MRESCETNNERQETNLVMNQVSEVLEYLVDVHDVCLELSDGELSLLQLLDVLFLLEHGQGLAPPLTPLDVYQVTLPRRRQLTKNKNIKVPNIPMIAVFSPPDFCISLSHLSPSGLQTSAPAGSCPGP